mgnify:CR=1 FL=1
MKYKSRGIPLTYIRHGESSIISKIFTEEKGLQTFIIKAVRSKKSKKKLSYFEPLKLLNINANFNAKQSLQYLGEVNVAANFDDTKNKIYKRFIGFFIAEVCSKVLQEGEKSTDLFNFMWKTTTKLYTLKNINHNFSLRYLLDLSGQLGFYPSLANKKNAFFELESGEFLNTYSTVKPSLTMKQSAYLRALIEKKEVAIPQIERLELLKELLYYYKLHHYNLDGVTSHLVIESFRK